MGRPPIGARAMTPAERQRRHRAKSDVTKPAATGLKALQAQAQDSTGLRQEITGLRQEVTALKQELAQQQVAKSARQEGLAMKALKAATTKRNGVVVGFHDANFEFHEAECPPPYPLPRRPFVPEEARSAMEKKWEETLPDKDVRAALERLATSRRVWGKLRNVKGVAEIIPSAIEALEMFPLRRPRPQSKRREAWRKYQQHQDKLWINHPHPLRGYNLLTCATWATDLRYVVTRLRNVLAPTSDEAAMHTMGATISVLQALADWLISIDDEHRSDVKRFPPVARWGLRARQRFFAQIMSDKMQELCGRPRRDVVAALVCVAFNVDDVTTDTVRDWCRKTGK